MKKKITPLLFALSICTYSAFAANSITRKTVETSTEKKTADSQMKGSESDVSVTRKIRDRLTDMDNLSMRAHNVTIITEGNNVTLKGEVDKQEEIQQIMSVVQETATGKSITNQLSVHK